jgi:DNA-binding CsgD family transcriptional regulator
MEAISYPDLGALINSLAEVDAAKIREPEKVLVLLLCGLMQLFPFQLFRPLEPPGAWNGLSGVLGLTRREAEVLTWVARGKSNAEIAAALFIAPGTVKKHLEHIYAKLGVRTRTEAVVKVVALLV